MLILNRRSGETITIGPDTSVTILEVNGNQVKVGIDAPRDVEVHRKEIYLRILDERSTQQRLEGTLSRKIST